MMRFIRKLENVVTVEERSAAVPSRSVPLVFFGRLANLRLLRWDRRAPPELSLSPARAKLTSEWAEV